MDCKIKPPPTFSMITSRYCTAVETIFVNGQNIDADLSHTALEQIFNLMLSQSGILLSNEVRNTDLGGSINRNRKRRTTGDDLNGTLETYEVVRTSAPTAHSVQSMYGRSGRNCVMTARSLPINGAQVLAARSIRSTSRSL